MLLLVVNIYVLIVASLDLSRKENHSTKKIVGEIFLNINMVLSMPSVHSVDGYREANIF